MTVIAHVGSRADEHVTFAAPLLGLGAALDYTLRTLDDLGTVFALHGSPLEDGSPGPRLFLVHAAAHVPSYQPPLTGSHLAMLGTQDAPAAEDDIATLVVLNPDSAGGGATVNLLAPVLVDTRTHRALQVVLDGDWPVRASLSPASPPHQGDRP